MREMSPLCRLMNRSFRIDVLFTAKRMFKLLNSVIDLEMTPISDKQMCLRENGKTQFFTLP